MKQTWVDETREEIARGLAGRNEGLTTGLERFRDEVDLRPAQYCIVGGNPGCGKTAFVDFAFVLFPLFEARMKQRPFRVLYLCMESHVKLKLAKWASLWYMVDTGKVIDLKKILGWSEEKMSKDEQKIIDYYLNKIEKTVIPNVYFLQEEVTPSEAYSFCRAHAANLGKFEQYTDPGTGKVFEHYRFNNEAQVVNVVVDNNSLYKLEKGVLDEKRNLDIASRYHKKMREEFGFSVTAIQHFNRESENVQRRKNNDFEPQRNDFKGTGNTIQEADLVLGMVNPHDYVEGEYRNLHVGSWVDFAGCRLRTVRVVKDRFGGTGGLYFFVFWGETGMFKTLPKEHARFHGREADLMTYQPYNSKF